ncbi:hypothetical protein GCM10011573_37920 [Enterococcus wangshanyuanii]|uniref:Uncharacterized protein n=1 Tax=Enterococcus wangshanyuanii TaxID=2005703 RepID=A0ABQ1PW21_9ENTE|nr:hypothetical protein GCM10011573_37920 [Enterococcus wangshanyuanii]
MLKFLILVNINVNIILVNKFSDQKDNKNYIDLNTLSAKKVNKSKLVSLISLCKDFNIQVKKSQRS